MSMIAFGCVTFVAAVFRGTTGFGYALIAALGIALLPSSAAAIPFIQVGDLVLTALLLVDRDHGRVDLSVARLLLVAGIAGAVCGSLLVIGLDETTARLAVSVAIVVAAGVAMIPRPPVWLRHEIFGVLLGFVVGALVAAFAVGGPLIAAWLLARETDRRIVKGTLAAFFGLLDGMGLAGRWALGGIDPGLGELVLAFVWPTLLGYLCGRWLSGRLAPTAWRRISSGGLLAIAVTGLGQTVLALGRGLSR